MINNIKKTFIVITAMLMFVLPMQSQAEEIRDTPSAAAMVFDGIIVRPITLVATALGTVFWVATLPFSLLGGNAGEAADVLIMTPAEATFLKCLGCNVSGRKVDFDDE